MVENNTTFLIEEEWDYGRVKMGDISTPALFLGAIKQQNEEIVGNSVNIWM